MSTSAAVGSSPLTRGKHPDDGADGRRMGLIPAHAGKTLPRDSFKCGRRAHPRSRGENAAPGSALGQYPGLIPAHAGKTRWRRARSPPRKAHPRSRGENTPEDRARLRIQGSSPLTRGKLRRHTPVFFMEGLIPAHAGKTRRSRSPRETVTAHPRSRGENICSSPTSSR